MKLRAEDIKVDFVDLHTAVLHIKVRKNEIQGLEKLDPQKTAITVEIKKERKKRSLNANAMCWALCDQIGEVIGTTREAIYRQAVHETGPYVDVKVPIKRELEAREMWHRRGIGWISDTLSHNGNNAYIRMYFGSSVYNTEQMALLIDWLLDEAHDMGIQSYSDKERTEALNAWEDSIN